MLRPDQLGLIYGINALGSITGGPLSALLWAMYADTADYAEWKTGRRATGLIFSAPLDLRPEAGLGRLGGVHASPHGEPRLRRKPGANGPLSSTGLVELMSIFPAALGILLRSLILVFLYPLNEKRMSEIAGDLRVRRAAEAAGVA